MQQSQSNANNLKKTLLQLFLYFSVQIETENYKSYVCVLEGKNCSFFGKFDVLYFLETSVIRFAVLSYYRRNWFMSHDLGVLSSGIKFSYIWYILRPTLSFNSKKLQNVSLFFYFSLLEWRAVKNRARDFWLHFYFLRYWPILYFCFCFLWNRY